MLICNKCNKEYPDEDFYKKRDTREKSCKYCKEALRKARFAANPQIAVDREFQRKLRFADNPEALDAQRIYAANYYQNNRDKQDAATRSWYKVHPEARLKSHTNWRRANRDRMRFHQNKRRATKMQATPCWAKSEWEVFLVSELYHLCILRQTTTGLQLQVDHIVPLQSDLVCGLHCFSNLQILTRSQNASKGNYYWPDMW